MFRNHFKTAIRNLLRNKNYAIINISGLAVGIAVCLAIFIIIQFELSFDNFHSKKDRIYRVLTEYHHSDAGNVFYGRGVPKALPDAIKAEFPQLEQVATIYGDNDVQVQVLNNRGESEKKFKEAHGVFYTVPALFRIIDAVWLAGDPTSALKDPNCVVLSRETATKYFGDWRSAVGKTIKINNLDLVKVTGILEDAPANTDLQMKLVASFGTGFTARMAKSTEWDGTESSFGCFVLLPASQNYTAFNEQLRDLVKKHKSPGNKDSHIIQPLSQIHFDTQVGNFSFRTISRELIRALWMIAAFILLIACVNFINLSTAQAVNRAKEVGVRKVLGSNKWQLQKQFLTETFLIVSAALVLSIGLAMLALPAIGRLLDAPLRFNPFAQPSLLLFLAGIAVAVTLLAGFYPSIVLSGFNPINALKSKLVASSSKGFTLRKGLVVVQFVIAQALIIGTIIIVKQMNFFTAQPLGFDRDAIVNVPFPGDSAGTSKLDALRQDLLQVKGLQQVSFNSNTPVEDNNDNWTTFTYNHAPKETDFYSINKFVDNEYVPTFKLAMAAGRNIEKSDTVREFLVNENLVKSLGVTNQDVIGKPIEMWDGRIKGQIVGVVKDFNDRSFRAPVAPLMMMSMKRGYSQAGIKLSTSNIPAVMKQIEAAWNRVYPDFVFEYQFMDAKIETFYKQENKLAQIYKMFAMIAIFLSCLGLYGLASFMAVQRIREVGIRKVLGASSGSIVYLFSREFVLLIGVAFLIASPIAWYFMKNWLQDYVFRIDMSWWIFVIGGAISVAVAMLTVSFQALKAAFANPVRSLRAL